MILETAQILSTVHHLAHYKNNTKAPPEFYKTTHEGHPCVHWAGLNDKNYYWTWCLFYHLSAEYRKRYRRKHATTDKLLGKLLALPPNIPISDWWTKPKLAMPPMYYHSDPVTAYRRYYIGEKFNIAKWNYCHEPWWWPTLKTVYQRYALTYDNPT
jgi:hypothetical protein